MARLTPHPTQPTAPRGAPRLALLLLASLVAGAWAGNRNDETYPPARFDPPGKAPGSESQAKFDRDDWLRVRFAGKLDKDFFHRTLQQIQQQAARHPELLPNASAPAFVPRWRSIGPVAAQVAQNGIELNVVDSGRVRSILPHPTEPDTLYLLSSGGGLWKTQNLSAAYPTWVPLTDATVTTSGGAAALGSNPSTVYLGLGDPFDGIGLVGGYMLRSTDGGLSWSAPFSLPTAAIVTDVKVDSSGAPDKVFAATEAGLYRSTDGGLSYGLVAGISPSLAVASVVKSAAGWLAATYVPDPCCRYGIGANALIYLSTDGGASFAPVNNPGGGFSAAARTTLAVGAPGDAVVYALANEDTGGASGGIGQRDLFRSADGGQSWTALGLNGQTPTNPNGDQPDVNLLHDQAWYNQMLLVDPTDASRNTVHVGGNLSTAKSSNGGRSWTLQTNWLAQFGLAYAHADHHAAAVSTAGGGKRLYFGNDGGLFVSGDGGTTWNDRKNVGLVNHLLYSLTGSGTDPSSVLTGLQDNGTRLRLNGSGVFNQTYGGDGFGVGWSQSNGGAVLGSYVGNYIYRSSVAPTTQGLWIDPVQSQTDPCLFNGIDNCNAYFYTTIATPNAAADPVGGTFFARGTVDVWRTANGGQSWQSLSLTDPNRTANRVRGAPHVVGVHPTDARRIAAAATGRRVRITTDGGASWATRRLPLTITDGFNSNVAWTDNTSFYVASENPAFQASGCWLAKTTDLGVTWQAACNGLPQVPISKVLVSPADPTGRTAYAATWIGVYRTINGGASWDQFGAGLPVVKVSDLYMPPRGGLLRVATYGRGVWEIATPK